MDLYLAVPSIIFLKIKNPLLPIDKMAKIHYNTNDNKTRGAKQRLVCLAERAKSSTLEPDSGNADVGIVYFS